MGTIAAGKGLDDPEFKALLDLQTSDEKCWVKITGLERTSASGKPFHDAVPFAKRLIDNAPDRVIWGTDWPHPNVKFMPNDGDIVDLVPLYAPDPAIQKKLIVNNPAAAVQLQLIRHAQADHSRSRSQYARRRNSSCRRWRATRITHIFGPGDKYPYAPDRPYTPPDAPLEDFQGVAQEARHRPRRDRQCQRARHR